MDYKISPEASIGHIHLTVKNLNRSIKFYTDLLGFHITTWYGDNAVFLSSNEYHHQIALNTWEGDNPTLPIDGQTGLYHFAILYPSRNDLAMAFKKLWEVKYPIEGATDSGITESIYILDPDENGIELYVDRPIYDWPRDDQGNPKFESLPLDLPELLNELDS